MFHAPESLQNVVPESAAIVPCAMVFLVLLRGEIFRKSVLLTFIATGLLAYLSDVLFGRAFCGIFVASFIAAFLLFVLEKDENLAARYVQAWGVSSFVLLSLLKLQCFIDGCCYGRFLSAPWATYYKFSPGMPYLFVPVHPVQLYESIGALLSAAAMVFWIRSKKLASARSTLVLTLVMMAALRSFCGYFRGDIAANNSIGGLYITHWISFALVAIAYGIHTHRTHVLRYAVVGICLVGFSSSCVIPDPVKPEDFKRAEVLPNGVEKYRVKKAGFFDTKAAVKRNALFLFGDELFSKNLKPSIQKYYPNEKDADLEHLVWWQYAPLLKQVYRTIYRIPQEKIGHQALIDSILALEAEGVDYDVIILTHGYPGSLTTGDGYFFSTEEFPLLPKLKHLNLVYMQACYGSTLMKSWLDAGAKNVIGFEGPNENIFWYYFFLRWYRFNDVLASYTKNNENLAWKIEHSFLFSKGLELLGQDMRSYVTSVQPPILGQNR